MNQVPEHKRREWQRRAAKKNAIVPEYFEVFVNKVVIICGNCKHHYQRALVFGVNEPVFACPNNECKARNWVPVTFEV